MPLFPQGFGGGDLDLGTCSWDLGPVITGQGYLQLAVTVAHRPLAFRMMYQIGPIVKLINPPDIYIV
jgi:hypothetical protein